MKKASRILLMIGGILGFITCGLFLIYGFILLANKELAQQVGEAVKLSPQGVAALSIYFIILGILVLVPSILGLRNKNRQDQKGKMILCLVLGLVFANELVFLGGLFGLIAAKKQ